MNYAEWAEFDFEKAEWRIPASKVKMKEQHIVPLSNQALDILREIQPVTGRGCYVLPSERGGSRPMRGFGGLQLCRTPARAAADDANLGGLLDKLKAGADVIPLRGLAA